MLPSMPILYGGHHMKCCVSAHEAPSGLLQVQTEEIAALLPALQAALAELKDMRKQVAAESGAVDVAKLRADLRADVRSDLRAELRTFVESINE